MHARATAASLGLLRIWVFGVWVVYLLFDPIHRLAYLPTGIFQPPGPLVLIPTQAWDLLLSDPGLWILRGATLTVVVLVLVGLIPRPWITVGAVALLTFYQGVLRGFSGHMNHTELMLLFASGVIALFPCYDALSLRRPPNSSRKPATEYSAPFVTIVVAFCLTYSFVGAARLAKGPDLFLSDTMRNLFLASWLEDHAATAWTANGVSLPFVAGWPDWTLKAAYLGSTVMELLAPLAIFSRAFRLVFVGFAIPFHMVNTLWLAIPFIENTLLLVVFSDRWFHDLAKNLHRRLTEKPMRHDLVPEGP